VRELRHEALQDSGQVDNRGTGRGSPRLNLRESGARSETNWRAFADLTSRTFASSDEPCQKATRNSATKRSSLDPHPLCQESASRATRRSMDLGLLFCLRRFVYTNFRKRWYRLGTSCFEYTAPPHPSLLSTIIRQNRFPSTQQCSEDMGQPPPHRRDVALARYCVTCMVLNNKVSQCSDRFRNICLRPSLNQKRVDRKRHSLPKLKSENIAGALSS
jgi:hypothetical protein